MTTVGDDPQGDQPESDPKPVYQVTANLDPFIFSVESRLQETLQFASFGLAAAEALKESDDISLPGVMLSLGDKAIPFPELRSRFSNWLADVVLRRYVEVYNAFLVQIGPVALLVERQREPFHYDSREIMRTFNSYRFPQKLDRIDKALSQKVDPTLRRYIESINHARNCFEHWDGIVSQRHLNPEGQCVISWLGADGFVRASEADEWKEVLALPVLVPPQGYFTLKWVPRERLFALGDHLSFTPKDLAEMGITYWRHSLAVSDAIKQASLASN